ncbi:MAG: ATP-binding protein [Cyanobacteria bacterium P01_C01_bin.120]|mgnify:CR=1 FL=1
MSRTDDQSSQNEQSLREENSHLKAQVATLEQLLVVYEQETIEKSTRLEKTLADLNEHTQRLGHSEATLATLRSMLNSLGDAVVVVDLRGQFLFLNAPAEKFLGIQPQHKSLQAWAKSGQIYLSDQETACPLSIFPLSKAIQGKTPQTTELFIKSPQAPEGNWFSVTARELMSPKSDRQGGIAVFHNITLLKQGEIALRASETRFRDQAEQLQEALENVQKIQMQMVQAEKMSSLGQLVAGIAHEINNPVNFISGNLSHAQQNVEDLLTLIELYRKHYSVPHRDIQRFAEHVDLPFIESDLPKLLSSLMIGSERIQQIVLSLRTFSRMDESEKKSVDIHSGIDSTLMILQSRLKADSKATAIQVVRDYGQLAKVECCAGQLNQVFMNLLSNAIDALEERRLSDSAEAPEIYIQTSVTADHQVCILLRDNGSGISKSAQQQIFNPFFTTKPVGKGTGMGLSISYQIVTERHGGTLECESEPGQGTTFKVVIPLS